MRNKAELLESMISEIDLQKEYLGGEKIETIYFGGGTPSVLSADETGRILEHIYRLFDVSGEPEITLEANPDDMAVDYLQDLRKRGINRLSIGIQSFFDDDLKWMNRRHDAGQSIKSIEAAKRAGYDNISIDLIYGIPGMEISKWYKNLEMAFSSDIQHFSAYHLTLENKTVYAHKVKKGMLQEPDEKSGSLQFELLTEMAAKMGFSHYEISNFFLPGFISRHNTSYWKQEPYLGIGPSANSYNKISRQWNVRNNSLYIKEISKGIIPSTYEMLSADDLYNEYILTSLRTAWGADENIIKENFGAGKYDHFIKQAEALIQKGKLEKNGNSFIIRPSWKFFADGIISDMFFTG